MRSIDIAALSDSLGREAEAVCRTYLSNGRRCGRYWVVGDVRNAPGRSMFVRLAGSGTGKGAAGRWTDAATGEHGDLLDVIRHATGARDFASVVDHACAFLNLPQHPTRVPERQSRPDGTAADWARRLFAQSGPIGGTVAETYLRGRGLHVPQDATALRFHPRCRYRSDNAAPPKTWPPKTWPPDTWPAMIAAVTDRDGTINGVLRTWLQPDGGGKASVDTPRRAMGDLRGHAVRFGAADDVMAAGEGIETMLSLRGVLPTLPMAAALSAAHLAAFLLPATLRRLYIARDNDAAGEGATAALAARAEDAGIEAIVLVPELKDFNDDLVALGPDALQAALRVQIAPQDVGRFMEDRAASGRG